MAQKQHSDAARRKFERVAYSHGTYCCSTLVKIQSKTTILFRVPLSFTKNLAVEVFLTTRILEGSELTRPTYLCVYYRTQSRDSRREKSYVGEYNCRRETCYPILSTWFSGEKYLGVRRYHAIALAFSSDCQDLSFQARNRALLPVAWSIRGWAQLAGRIDGRRESTKMSGLSILRMKLLCFHIIIILCNGSFVFRLFPPPTQDLHTRIIFLSIFDPPARNSLTRGLI